VSPSTARAGSFVEAGRDGEPTATPLEPPRERWTENDFLWVQDPAEEWLEAARITQEALRRLHRAVTDEGAGFVLVNGTTRIQVHPNEIARVAAAHPEWNLDGPQRFLAETAAESRFAYYDLVPGFREAASDGVYLHGCPENGGEGHWNERGHQLAAESIARFLASP
jgi:hypothetical protein